MRKTSLRPVAAALALMFIGSASAGCFGKFGLTKKVLDWNASLGNKFVVSLVFFILLVVPVYEISTLVDWALLNVIEFWTGSNPVGMAPGETKERLVINDDGTQLRMTISDQGNAMRVEITEVGKATKVMQFRRTADGMEMVDGSGALVASMQSDAAQLMVTGANGQILGVKSQADVNELSAAMDRGAAPAVVALHVQQDLGGMKLAKSH